MLSVNFLAVFVAALASFVLGAAWYSPLMFASAWVSARGGAPDETSRRNLVATFGATFAADVVMAWMLAYLIGLTDTRGLVAGAQAGFFAWLGFVATTGLKSHLFAGHPRTLYVIDFGYHLASLVVMGVILAAWR